MNNQADKNRRFMMILLLFIGYFMIYVDKTSIGLTAVKIEEEFGLTSQQIGYITGAFFLAYSLCQIPMGWLNDRIGYKKVLLISLGLSGIFAFFFGSLGFSLLTLIIFRFLSGISHAGYPSASVKAVTLNFDQKQRTFVQSILLSSAGLAFIAGPIIIGYLLRVSGWRVPYLGIGIIQIVIAVLILRYIPAKNVSNQPVTDAQTGPKIGYLALLKNPVILLLFVVNFGINIPAYGMMAWLPKYLVQMRELNVEQMSYLIAIGGLSQWVASVAGGWFVGRYMQDREHIVIFVSSIIGAICIWMIYQSQSLPATIAYMVGGYFCAMISFVTTFTLPMKRLPADVIGSAVGLVNSGGTFGGFVAPVLVGYLLMTTHGGLPDYSSAFLVFMGGMLITAVAVLPLGRKRPHA